MKNQIPKKISQFMTEIAQSGVPINTQQFDNVAAAASTGNQEALDLLNRFSQREDAWMYSDSIFSNCSNNMAKSISIKVLQNFIDHSWLSSPPEAHNAILSFVTSNIGSLTASEASSSIKPEEISSITNLLSFLDNCLVHIMLYEWPQNMPNFLADIISSAASDPPRSRNYLIILHRFYEEIDEENEENSIIEHDRICYIRSILNENANSIYNFVYTVMVQSNKPDVVSVSLKIIKELLPVISNDLISSAVNNLFNVIATKYLPTTELVAPVIGVLGEIFNNPLTAESLSSFVPQVFSKIIETLQPLIPSEYDDFVKTLSSGLRDPEYLAKMLSFAISIFLDKWGPMIESSSSLSSFHNTARLWMLDVTLLCENPHFQPNLQSCAEFWLSILKRVITNGPSSAVSNAYFPIFPHLRRVLIRLMPRPKEVLIEVTDTNEIQRAIQSDTLDTNLFTAMKTTLKSLAKIDIGDTLNAINDQFDNACSTPDIMLYDSACYSMSAISGTMPKDLEKKFLTAMLTRQMDLFNSVSDPSDRAMVAAGIMYVCTQYTTFLSDYTKLLFSCIEKLFEFMTQSVPGLQEMAVDSFAAIAKTNSCKKHLCSHSGPNPSYISIFISTRLESIISSLPRELISPLYQSIANITSFLQPKESQELISMMLAPLNEKWAQLQANFNPGDQGYTETVSLVINSNAAIALAIKKQFAEQISSMITPLMDMYKKYSEALKAYSQQPGNPSVEPLFVSMKGVKAASVKMIMNYISTLSGEQAKKVSGNLLPLVIPGIIEEFMDSPPSTRVPEVIQFVITLFEKMKEVLTDRIPIFYETIFHKTREMIANNFEDFPTFRAPFYDFIYIMIKNFIHVIAQAPFPEFQALVETILFGIQHPQQQICQTSLDTLLLLCQNLNRMGNQVWRMFMENFHLELILKIFQNIIDTVHKFAFDTQVTLLISLMNEVHSEEQINPIGTKLMEVFPQSSSEEIGQHLMHMMETCGDRNAFRQAVRDFLIMTRHYKANDAALTKEEKTKQDEKFQSFLDQEPTEADFLE